MATGDVWAVKMRFFQVGVGKTFAPGFHLLEAGVVAPVIGDVATHVEAMWAAIADIYDPSTEYVGCTLRRVKPIAAIEVVDEPGAAIPGTAAATDPLPVSSAVVVNLRTDNIGKSYRGRIYLPAPAESMVDQTLAEADAIQIADAIDAMGGDFGADTTPLCIFSRLLNVGTQVTSIRVDRRMRSQRRRQVKAPSYVSPT